ncbi:MAG: class I mannose-6-phosphate isomerase [Bacteroidaceae bacterium]|nr:class I mannose-6-phosphate isomerase [Bacteroidaceae bacterium]
MLTPLKFSPVLKAPLWAGRGIVDLKRLKGYATVGESWEISGVPGDETLVSEGIHKGRTLRQLTEEFEGELVGRANFKRYGTEFPLLIKFISADGDLSIQVHPDDAMAWRHGKPYGKTEMWYIIGTEPGATLYSGFSHDLTPEEYDQIMAEGTLCDHMAQHETQVGDCFFIPAGQIHSIGSGNLLIEVQQSSDLTYRVFDFNRRDADGNLRELHTELAREALNFKARAEYRTQYEDSDNTPVLLEKHPEFTTSVLHLTEPMERDLSEIDSFVILVCYEGRAALHAEGYDTTLRAGESILLPACTQQLTLTPTTERFSCIETYV